MTPHQFASEYEFRGDGGDHVPTENERAMIEDAIEGYLSVAQSSAQMSERINVIVRDYGLEKSSASETHDALIAVLGVAQAPTQEAIARIIAPQYFWQLDNTESGGRIYAAELETARSQADAILALYPVSSTDRGGK